MARTYGKQREAEEVEEVKEDVAEIKEAKEVPETSVKTKPLRIDFSNRDMVARAIFAGKLPESDFEKFFGVPFSTHKFLL